jgi:hypothetical protein
MGFELGNGTLYMMDPNGRQFELDDGLYGDIEIDTLNPNETPDIYFNLTSAVKASFEVTTADLEYLAYKPFEPAKDFWFEFEEEILIQAKWHKKKRINKKWLKRYGMKSDTVKVRAKARALDYGYLAGEFDFETDKLEYIWRPDQKRKNLKIEM